MKIQTDTALWIQETLLGLDGEEWGIAYITGGMPATIKDNSSLWQLAVDLIYRALSCDLVEVDSFTECHDQSSLLLEIRKVSPFEDLGGFLWNGTQVHGTKRLNTLFQSHFPSLEDRNGKLSASFIQALEQIFAENGVPWSDKPLLPIMPTAGDAKVSAPH